MKRLLFFICTLLCANVLFAFTIDSLSYFRRTSTNPPTVVVDDAEPLITTANIPSTVTYQGTSYSVTSIGYEAFKNCTRLTSVTIPNSVTSIGHWAFYYCISLTSVNIPNSVTSIGFKAFRACCSLTSVTIPNSVTEIGVEAFKSCSSLTSVDIPNSVTSIYRDAFSGCSSLTSVTIPNSVTSIGDYAFQYCISLTSVTIPNSVTSIGYEAFFRCWSLTSVTCLANNPPDLGDYAFYNIGSPSTLYVPNGCRQAYVNSAWAQWFDCIVELCSDNSIPELNVEVNNEEWGHVEVNEWCGNATLRAVADNDCYQFVSWNDGNTENPRLVSLSSDTSFTATFEELPNHNYNVNVSINNDAFGSVSIENDCNSSTLTATANDCYEFISWSDGNTDNPRTINLESDTALTAIFNGILNSSITATICQGEVYQEQGFNASEAGIYTQILEASNGCDSVVMLTLNVNPAFDTTINATINIGDVYSEYGFNETEDGTYVQNLQTEAGCDSTITLNLTVNSSLYDVAEFAELSVYPNPTRGKVSFNQAIEKIEVIDLSGKTVQTYENANEINIEALPAGVYHLRMTIGDKTTTRKIIKE